VSGVEPFTCDGAPVELAVQTYLPSESSSWVSLASKETSLVTKDI
jgi:hypothetical protein